MNERRVASRVNKSEPREPKGLRTKKKLEENGSEMSMMTRSVCAEVARHSARRFVLERLTSTPLAKGTWPSAIHYFFLLLSSVDINLFDFFFFFCLSSKIFWK